MTVFEDTDALTLFTAGKCNLNCSYCYLHKNNDYKVFDDELVEAYETGTYIENCVKVFKRLGINRDNIKRLELWGGETLLHVDLLTKNVPAIFKNFKNISLISISTNFMVDIDKVIEFLKAINTYANKTTYIYFQTSIDGPEGKIMETGHSGNWAVYKKNFEKLAQFFNNTRLNRLKSGSISLKPTISREVYLDYFSKDENIEEYMDYLHNTLEYLYSIFVNPNFKPAMAMPCPSLPMSDYTIDDALQLNTILSKWDALKIKKYNSFETFRNDRIVLDNLSSAIGGQYRYANIYPGKQTGCFKQIADMTILPDGTLTDCSSDYILGRQSYYDECVASGAIDDARIAKIYQKFNFNPLKMTDEELEEAVWSVAVGSHYNLTTTLNLTLGMMDEMALSGQIPWRYHSDMELRLRTASFICNYANCLKNNFADTGVPFLRCFGAIKFAIYAIVDRISAENKTPKSSVTGGITYNDDCAR